MAIIEKKLAEMGIELTKKPDSGKGLLTPCKQAGNILYVSGHGTSIKGKVGADLTVEQGAAGAREAIIGCLNTIYSYLGDLDRVKSVLKLLGMVNCAPDFTDTPAVINGGSSVLVEAFGPEAGRHARSAVGMGSLPGGIAVEIEMIVELKD